MPAVNQGKSYAHRGSSSFILARQTEAPTQLRALRGTGQCSRGERPLSPYRRHPPGPLGNAGARDRSDDPVLRLEFFRMDADDFGAKPLVATRLWDRCPTTAGANGARFREGLEPNNEQVVDRRHDVDRPANSARWGLGPSKVRAHRDRHRAPSLPPPQPLSPTPHPAIPNPCLPA